MQVLAIYAGRLQAQAVSSSLVCFIAVTTIPTLIVLHYIPVHTHTHYYTNTDSTTLEALYTGSHTHTTIH